MKIAIVGGHLAPALAVIDKLPEDSELFFIGRKSAIEGDKASSLEYDSITKKGITFIPLTTGRVQRNFTRYTFSSFMKIPGGLIRAIQILINNRPDVVLGFGGYLSVPVGMAAALLNIPLVIHEQTLDAGLANKLLGRFAAKVCISWKQSSRYFSKEKLILTGNPLREFNSHAVYIPVLSENRHIPLIYVTGGGTGAHIINKTIEGCIGKLLETSRVIHQTGSSSEYNDYERLELLRSTMPQKLQRRYYLTKFVHPYDVGAIMEAAHLVISRSGMNTMNEILFFGKPCLLVPLPFGQHNEQLKNAQFIKKIGIGDYLMQKDFNVDTLLIRVEAILGNRARYLAFSKEAKSLIRTDAAERIKNVLYEVVAQK